MQLTDSKIKFKLKKKMKLNAHNVYKYAIILAITLITISIWFVISSSKIGLGNLSVIRYSDMILSIFSSEEKGIDNNVLLVNVCYDKELAPVYDKYGFPMGNTAITDRCKLNSLLENLRRYNNYKYILMDVFLTPDFKTSSDSALFSNIATIRRIIIPKHQDGHQIDSAIIHKAAYADYSTNFWVNDFEKYPLFINNQMSIAAAMYAQNKNKELCQNPIFAKENGRLIYKSIIPKFHIRPNDDYDSSGNKIIYQLGEDLLSLANDSTAFKNLIQDKWIVIGDFSESDIHQTYNGNIAGPLIIFNTFLNLLQGNHYVKWWYITILFALFFFMCKSTVCNRNDITVKNKFLSLLLSWISYSIIMTIVCLISYYCFSMVVDIFFISTIFAFYRYIFNWLKSDKYVW